MHYVRNFTNLNKSDVKIAGGKGASLGEMTQAGILVPPGFVVLTDCFDQFISKNNLDQEIDGVLYNLNHEEIQAVEVASKVIRALILSQKIPLDIVSEINDAFKKLDTEYVAVRSSATTEDSKEHAWAGQLESFLNVEENSVLEKVKLCWSSLFTPRAIFYRITNGLSATKISVAVVVQKMVESEFSGIAFSLHPVTLDANQMLIEAGFGLGEAIVSGSVTPDSYVLEKVPRKIIDISNGWNTRVLNEQQILDLSNLIMYIENHYGFPCDIEWAYEGGKWFVLQSRPITTLKEPRNLESYIATQHMVSLGVRGPDIREAQLKIMGWSSNFRKEFGVGFKTMVINSKGEQFGDRKSWNEIDAFFKVKDFSFVHQYIGRMNDLNKKKSENLEELSWLFTYFIAVRWVIEEIYEHLNSKDQKYIDEWRNNTQLFSSLIAYNKNHPPQDPKKWSLIGVDGVRTQIDTVITCKQKSHNLDKKEIRGKIGYPGIVTGRARVVLTDEIRDSIQEGEIIVAPMTTLDFMSAMAKASAFVTDEGGITCHAAIVAREMKKPCIIGTRIGTKVIKDGDTVEVDAYNGIIKIIT